MPQELPIRITLIQPPPGVIFGVQEGKTALLAPIHKDTESLSFDFTLRIGAPQANGAPNLLGSFAQGTPADRFVYVNSGTSAGQIDSCWTRRAKVKLAGITQGLIDTVQSTPGTRLEARIAGKAKDGGPACASVPLLGEGWQVVTK